MAARSLFAAGKRRGAGVHAFAKPHPGKQFAYVGAVAASARPWIFSGRATFSYVVRWLSRRQFLEHDANTAAQLGQFRSRQGRNVLPEHCYQPP